MLDGSEYEYIAYPKLNHVKVGFVEIFFRKPHLHRELEMGLVLDGRASMQIGGHSFPIRRGSLYFVNANEAHNVISENQESVRIAYVQISNHFCQEYFKLLRNLEIECRDITSHISAEDNATLTGMMLDVARSYLDDGELSQLHGMNAVCTLLSRLLDVVPYTRFDESAYQARKRRMTRLQRITDYISAHYTEKLSLGALAEMEGVSVEHLSHFIRENLNMSYQDYVNNLRLEKAVQLIANTRLRLTDICLECGFSETKYLNKAFKKQFNCLPKEYRSEHIQDRSQKSDASENQYYASERTARAWLEYYSIVKVYPLSRTFLIL